MTVPETSEDGRETFRTPDTVSSSIPGESPPRFTFVFKEGQADIRSHAMRESWKRRHKKKREKPKPLQQTPRKLLSSAVAAANSAGHSIQQPPLAPLIESQYPNIESNEDSMAGVPFQALTGMNHALAVTRVDPFDTCPVKLTGQHQKLLHHWLSIHAKMMLEEVSIKSFNPMRDISFPLDLSNASSFNSLMAHSAAHLAYLQGATDSLHALNYKTEALRILNIWLNDPVKSLSDDAFAAVVRLLAFESFWGTEAEWQIHRDGLQRMIEERGGHAALQDNWRVGLVVYLYSLMVKPSWFDPSNNIREISQHPLNNSLNSTVASIIDLHKVRCSWLISFTHHIQMLMRSSSQLYQHGLGGFRAVHDAVLQLHFYFQCDARTDVHEVGYATPEDDRLACLFLISVLLQGSLTSTAALPISPGSFSTRPNNSLAILDTSLHESRNLWEGSVGNLRSLLYEHVITVPDGWMKAKYAMDITDILRHLSLEARRGVEKCLLNILSGTNGAKLRFSHEDSWTPDSLLSSMHGE
ncbi:hypothetical protein V1517DRAFT_264826 [Lipomyces orientalis]|uniref:Uncharacterized protein n=1 Tax=Lipomyces orientalis TaxID=1233043 RepID=A0ACC3TH51_9ASCO